MGFDDRAADRQPDAEPFRFGAAEGGEEGAVRSAADAGSGVGDAYLDEVSGGAGDDLDLADGRTLHGLDGVADDVDQYLLRSEEHTSELQSLMRNSYAVFCLKKKKDTTRQIT